MRLVQSDEGVLVHEQGLDVEGGKQRGPHAHLIWITPSHQFPTEVTMSLPRRLALLEGATILRPIACAICLGSTSNKVHQI